ncbi:MAG: DUF4400 domain-containing protein [Azonexus sp.]|jgi:hypothetical protein|nr:DUF4400 domain-containing protein [Azonexus sp.]
MAGDSSTFERGITKAITSPFRTALFLAIAVLVIVMGRMAIDMGYTGSDPERIEALRSTLNDELDKADAHLPHILGSPSERAARWSAIAYDLIYVKTGLDRSMVATPSDFSELDLAVRRGFEAAAAQPHWQAMMLGTKLLAVRSSMIIILLPTIAFAWALGITDGVVARWKRRSSGGRESSTIYHRAKYSHVTFATIGVIVWLWLPVQVQIWQLGLFLAIIGSSLLRVQIQFYKKYI